jgi:hypothetical protein
VKKPGIFLAGKESSGERGRSPLSKLSPPLEQYIIQIMIMILFERGSP